MTLSCAAILFLTMITVLSFRFHYYYIILFQEHFLKSKTLSLKLCSCVLVQPVTSKHPFDSLLSCCTIFDYDNCSVIQTPLLCFSTSIHQPVTSKHPFDSLLSCDTIFDYDNCSVIQTPILCFSTSIHQPVTSKHPFDSVLCCDTIFDYDNCFVIQISLVFLYHIIISN